MPTPRLRALAFRPFERFFRLEAAGGIVLLAATLAALAWANSPFFQSYFDVWTTRAAVALGTFAIDKPVLLWINDGLMAVFFLLVGLEIKREFVTGELSDRRSAALPVIAAVGGMVVPALIFVALTRGTPAVGAWGVPMATDIAFALGALAVLGRRIPPPLRVFLAATAIVDDVGAVLVIAFVYTPSIALGALGVAAAALVVLVVLNRMHVTRLSPYMLLGVVLWVAVLKSGVHATIAGVLLALAIPARAPPHAHALIADADALTDVAVADVEPTNRAAAALAAEKTLEASESPLERLEHALVPAVTFAIIPLFALANAGVRIEGSLVDSLAAPVSVGIILGLVVGKQVGILLFPWLAIRAGAASLPVGVGWRHIWGAAWLAGIGFTMALFVAGLALPPEELARAKLAILAASTIAAAGGILTLMSAPRARVPART